MNYIQEGLTHMVYAIGRAYGNCLLASRIYKADYPDLQSYPRADCFEKVKERFERTANVILLTVLLEKANSLLICLTKGIIATVLTQPLDVIKTRMMNAKKGEFLSVMHCIRYTAYLGPLAFYKGFVPSAARIAPHTILVFIFYENMTKFFGYVVKSEKT